MNVLYGLHDRDAHPVVPAGGWCVDAVLVNESAPNYAGIRADINWIVRLNWGWYPNGTLPPSSQYADFAKLCGAYVAAAKGCSRFIIANEPNHEQEWPYGVKIAPEEYSNAYNQAYQAIKRVRSDAQVLVAALAPWNNQAGDWLAYYDRMLEGIKHADGFAIHGYTHGSAPNLIWDTTKVQGWYWHFPVIYQTIDMIPSRFAHLPCYVTETDQGDDPWADTNSGWVQNAFESINDYNAVAANQPIECLCLYRWRGDKWEFYNKAGVRADFAMAADEGYASPGSGPGPTPPDPNGDGGHPTPPDPQPTPPLDVSWDKRLNVRGCTLQPALAMPGQTVWRCIMGRWYNKEEAQGRVNTFVTLLDENEQLVKGVNIRWYWQGGQDVVPSEVKSDPWLGHNYSRDFSMYEVAPSYGLQIADGNPTDDLWGMGLGTIENPDYKEHVAYEFIFQRVPAAVQPPDPPDPPKPPIDGTVVHPLPGAVITQHFYQNPQNYTQFNMPGHNGTDFGNKAQGTPVGCIAEGTVAYTGYDDGGYGNYVRVAHPQLGAYSFYGHLQQVSVQVGQSVGPGQPVGLLGTTGNSTGVHLHLEIRLMDAKGGYRAGTPMPQGRVDAETFMIGYGVDL